MARIGLILGAVLCSSLCGLFGLDPPQEVGPRPQANAKPRAPAPEEWKLEDFAPSKDFVKRPYGLRSYNGMARCVRWTLERIDKKSKAGDRTGLDFHANPTTPAEFRVSPANYAGTGEELGHAACALYHGASREELESTFETENAMPQPHELNGGPWRVVEAYLFEFAHAAGVREIFVFTGSAWLPEEKTGVLELRTIGPRHVWVPTHCVKSALIVFNDGSLKMLTWCFSNTRKPERPKEARISTDLAEGKLGLDLWRGLPDELEDELEGAS